MRCLTCGVVSSRSSRSGESMLRSLISQYCPLLSSPISGHQHLNNVNNNITTSLNLFSSRFYNNKRLETFLLLFSPFDSNKKNVVARDPSLLLLPLPLHLLPLCCCPPVLPFSNSHTLFRQAFCGNKTIFSRGVLL